MQFTISRRAAECVLGAALATGGLTAFVHESRKGGLKGTDPAVVVLPAGAGSHGLARSLWTLVYVRSLDCFGLASPDTALPR